MEKIISDLYVNLTVTKNKNELLINGILKDAITYKKKIITAPNQPDIRTSYSGTALPFPCEDIALENTKNYKEIGNDGIISVNFKYPNSYYKNDGITKIKSPIIIIIDDKKLIYELEDLCPLKTLRDRVRGNPSFYAFKEILLPVATAENNMYNYAAAKINYNIA